MNNKQRKVQKAEKKVRFTLSTAHIVIAVVAIIECLILIGFTTFSWIETASSLHIWNGKQSIIQSEAYTKMDIVNNHHYQFQVGSASSSTSNASDLNDYFRSVKFYQFSKTSSPDGKDFYFKRPTTASSGYRKGDTTDYNTSYTYFDFSVLNSGYTPLTKLKFFFADADVFKITPGTSGLTQTDCTKIEQAMRISFQSGTGSGAATVYSEFNESTRTGDTYSYDAIANTTGGVSSVTTHKILNSQDQKLFTVGKSGTVQISCRVWLESQDPALSGYTALQLAGLDITVNLKLSYASNEFDYLYFDDYTLSNAQANNGGHLTEDLEESNSNRMYFVYKATSTATGVVYPMTHDSSSVNANAAGWVTCDSTGAPSATVPNSQANPYIDNLCGLNSSSAYQYSYFAYGPCNLTTTSASGLTPTYTWYLNTVSNDNYEHRYNAYSVVKAKTGASAGVTSYGAGGWNYKTPLSLIYFRDLATGLTNVDYNAGSNFKYITDSVNTAADTDVTKERVSVLYLSSNAHNIANSGSSLTDAQMTNVARATVNMYYDTNADNRNGLFKSWVPDSWLTSSSLTFRYCTEGILYNSSIEWTVSAPSMAVGSDAYVYTALGYDGNYTVDYYSTIPSPASGSGTWNAIESQPISFSSELIDNMVDSAQRYKIGVKIGTNTSYSYYHLVPDETNQLFYAYIPDPNNGNTETNLDYAQGAICFEGYDDFGGYDSAPTPTLHTPVLNAQWLANARSGNRTFYPVKLDATTDALATSGLLNGYYTRGFWNISVIVDGTYEHLFWDYGDPNTSSDDGVLGNFYFNTSGHPDTDPDASTVTTHYTEVTPYTIDEYRWYVPLDQLPSAQFVYYRWDPYSDVTLKFNHSRSDGIYCIVTEAPDNPPAAP